MSCYFVLEGPDSCGKSTQAAHLARWLEQRGRRVLHLREPGSTPVGEKLRELLMDPSSGDMTPWTEALLFTAARTELVRRVVRPALSAGQVVVAERCYLSTWVYQGLASAGEGVPLQLLRELTARAHCGLWPDRIFVLDVPYDVGLERRAGRAADRIEAKDGAYHERVRAGYARLAAEDERCALVDASQPAAQVEASVCAMAVDALERMP